jgi:hypothetical protein
MHAFHKEFLDHVVSLIPTYFVKLCQCKKIPNALIAQVHDALVMQMHNALVMQVHYALIMQMHFFFSLHSLL